MKRTKLSERSLPNYTRGEEIFNMVSHIAGGGIGIAIAALCIIKAFLNWDAYQIVSSFIYGFSMIVLYTMSSIYHGLVPITAKKVFQIIDHCAIFVLIAGTYTPISLTSLRENNPALGWVLFSFVWGVAILGVSLNSIDLKRFSLFSNICYILLGWCAVFILKYTIAAVTLTGFWWLLAGGISYTVGAVFFAFASKKNIPYLHAVFHIFVVIGSLLQFICIFFYVLV